MSLRSWYVLGWLLMLATAILAIAGGILAVYGIGLKFGQPTLAPLAGSAPSVQANLTQFMLGIVLAVCAGVTFFSGLAAFFWGAMSDHRKRLDKILGSRNLSRPAGHTLKRWNLAASALAAPAARPPGLADADLIS